MTEVYTLNPNPTPTPTPTPPPTPTRTPTPYPTPPNPNQVYNALDLLGMVPHEKTSWEELVSR